jgi:TatA/E family protein of Tat protein translocase
MERMGRSSEVFLRRIIPMMGIGGPELMVIVILALILFGGKKLPEIGRTVGKAMREFRNVMREFTEAVDLDEWKK